jgi:hypothetical protein
MPSNANLELTNLAANIIGPLVKTMVRLATNESIERSEAITRSGSDQSTEHKLAALIGRLRLDETLKIEFKRTVSKSDQTVISKYMQDLILEAGAGPTIQQAIASSDPALLSMAAQISFLSFGHNHQSLAQAIEKAIEETLKLSNVPENKGLDYISVLGVITVCQQQTAAFGWSYFYLAVEHKILESIKEHRDHSHRTKIRRTGVIQPSDIPSSITERGLPYVILRSLLIHLISVQDFPDHRLLQLFTNRGISTIVVWCYYILGLSVKVTCGKVDVLFGPEPFHIYVVECDAYRVSASLLERVEEGEPIFTFSELDSDHQIESEYRLEAKGFGKKALALAGVSPEEAEDYAHLLAAACLKHFNSRCKQSSFEQLGMTTPETCICDRIAPSTLFLFDMVDFDKEKMRNLLKAEWKMGKKLTDRIKWQSYVVLIYLFARISDLRNCDEAPLTLSLKAFQNLKKDNHGIYRIGDSFNGPLPDILLSYDLFARLLRGSLYSKDSMERTCLISAYGWSIFFDSLDAADPADVAAGLLHLRLGVPTRLGSRRTRIVDGPTDVKLSSTRGEVLNNEKPMVAFWPGVWSSRYTGSFIGNQDRDAFAVVQHFEWAREENKSKSWKYGFREKMQGCKRFILLGPCSCNEEKTTEENLAWIDSYISQPGNKVGNGRRDDRVLCKYPFPEATKNLENLSPERVFCKESREESGVSTWFFFVGTTGAARWLASDSIIELIELYENPGYNYLVRGKYCCIQCAVEQVESRSFVLL